MPFPRSKGQVSFQLAPVRIKNLAVPTGLTALLAIMPAKNRTTAKTAATAALLNNANTNGILPAAMEVAVRGCIQWLLSEFISRIEAVRRGPPLLRLSPSDPAARGDLRTLVRRQLHSRPA